MQPSGAIQNHKGLAPTLHKLSLQAAIESHQMAAMVHRQGQQVGVGELGWIQQAIDAH